MTAALEGVRVVEVAVGVSDLELAHAGGVPGRLLADLGAAVTRVVGTGPVAADADVPWGRVWHRGKRIARTDDATEIRALLADADVAFLYGPDALVEGRGLGWADLDRPELVHVRVRGESGFLTEAAAGFCTQLAGHRTGPILVDTRAATSGAAFLATTSALALLRRRAITGEGGCAETSLHDGLLATLGCMIGRSERAPAKIEEYWAKGSYFPNFLYRCGDGELVQIWFGGKGMYASVIEVLGDEPSEDGYYAEQMNGLLQARAERWRSIFPTRPRQAWIDALRAVGVACEPVNGPGEALADPHLAEVGLAVHDGTDTVLGPVIAVDALTAGRRAEPTPGPRLLEGVRVADFSAFVAGPLAAEVLADLGAEVVKVEPPEGEAMRAAAYAIAACQRGKRSIALDLGAAQARPVVEALLGWADVVLHNFRVGVAERLGIDAATVAAINPGAVHCHASAFGPTGPRATLPGNDALMQAVCGFEVANGGAGNDPIAATWIPIDMSGGWVAAAGILAGLRARAATGRGQRVDSSLLGAGMLLHGGVFLRDGEVVRGPALDADQTGYGPGHRLVACAGGTWLALVIPDEPAWAAVGHLVEASLPVAGNDAALRAGWDEPASTGTADGPARTTTGDGAARREDGDAGRWPTAFAPVRGGERDGDARAAEALLEAALATAPAAEWVARLEAAGARAVEVDPALDRDGFRRRILADAERAVTYETREWGRFEQIGPLFRCGPDLAGGPSLHLPGIGEHSVEVLALLGIDADTTAALLEAGVVRQLEPGGT